MSELHLPWLEFAVLVPLVMAAVTWRISNPDRLRTLSVATTALTLLLTLGEWIDFSRLATYEAHDHWDVLRWIFRSDVFVIDELSAPLLPLAALLYLATTATTLRTKITRFSFSATLASEGLLLAMLSCRNEWLIIALLALSCLPVWRELVRRGQNARVFGIHMGASVMLLIVGQSMLDFGSKSSWWFPIGGFCLTAGALIRGGVAPLHCWMTDLFEKVTLGTAILFLTPMTGAYAIMRLVFPIAPPWALQSIAVLSLATAVYAAGMALVQKDTRRLFCFVFLSHASLVLVGLEMATEIGLAGGLCVWLSVGISLLGFGLALRSVEARTGRLTLDRFHGLSEHTPFLAAMFLITGLASIGFPGTVGFIGMELLTEGAVEVYPGVGFSVVLAAALNGIAVVRAYFHVFTGTRHASNVSLACRPVERITILVVLVLIIGGGLWPQPGVHSRYHAADELLKHRLFHETTDDEGAEHAARPSTDSLSALSSSPQGLATRP